MTVPYEVTGSDMSRLFIPEGECNGQGSRHVVDGALIRFKKCKCEVCTNGKAEREQKVIDMLERMEMAKAKLRGGHSETQAKLENYHTDRNA